MFDRLGRTISYIRLSITDRCNLRCRYCMPEEGVPLRRHDELLHVDDWLWLAGRLKALGVERLRVTGGEPLVHRGLLDLLRGFRELGGLSLALTTNGTLVAPVAVELAALVDDFSVSLDSLNPQSYRAITRNGRLEDALAGLEALTAVTRRPVKVNSVVIRGVNDDQIVPLVDYAARHGLIERFIEFMPMGPQLWSRDLFMPAAEIRSRLPQPDRWHLDDEPTARTAGPSVYWRHQDTGQKVGFIAAVSEHFCAGCNRLRVTSTGVLYPCLFSDRGVDLRPAVWARDEAALDGLIDRALDGKPEAHDFDSRREGCMSRLGG